MFGFADPWVLVLLMVPLLINRIQGGHSSDGPTIMVPDSVGRVLRGSSRTAGLHAARHWALPILLWISLVTALAGPRNLLINPALPVTGRDLILALDLSGSMVREDFLLDGQEVARLDALKHVARSFVLDRGGDRVALVIFASRAYFATPQTHDVTAVARAIDQATIGVSGRATSISDGLGLALKRLGESPAASKVVILLSDGVNNSGPVKPRDAAQLAETMGVRVHTIAMGPRDLSNADGERDAVDTETLRAIADLSGGKYFRAKTTDDLQAVADSIDQLETIPAEGPAALTYRALWIWPAGFAALLTLAMLIGARR
ncbi:MAG: VWA domain-containing protein [Pseudomonadota bacterium]